MQQVELAAVHYLLSAYSRPCFSEEIVYNYGLRGFGIYSMNKTGGGKNMFITMDTGKLWEVSIL